MLDIGRRLSKLLWNLSWTRVFLHISLSWLLEFQVYAAEPSFRVPVKNITYTQGDTAVLECTIHNLNNHKVVWTDRIGFVLTLNQKRIIEDVRISVERPTVKDWNLHIQNVNYTDGGNYTCQINTVPVKERKVLLIVQVPPRIIDSLSSVDKQTVREGDTVVLVCNATGVPLPEIRWFRQSLHSNFREHIEPPGEILKIHNVSRECGATYICEADNGIGTKQSRKMVVDVQYPPEVSLPSANMDPPEVTLPSAKMGQYPGKETFLQCEVTAFPLGEFYWARDGITMPMTAGQLGNKAGKYTQEMYNTDDDHKKVLSLRIRNILPEDYGMYACVAKNILGEDSESMLLYDYTVFLDYTTRKTTTTTHKALIVAPGPFTTPRPNNRGTGYIIKGEIPRTRDGKGRNKLHNGGSTGAVRGSNSSPASRPSVFAVTWLVALLIYRWR